MDQDSADLRRALAEALRELRQRRAGNWSQEALAKKVGIDLGGLERGERLPSIGVLWRLAKAFRMSPSRIVAAIDQRYLGRRGGVARRTTPLAAEQQRLRAMAEGSPLMMWIAGPAQQWVYVNPAYLRFTGRALEEELGDGWAETLHPEDRAATLELYSAAFDARRVFSNRCRVRQADGEYRPCINQGIPQYAPGELFAGYVGSFVDVGDIV